jgi:hypothetical protein
VAARPGGVPICANCRVMTNPRMMYKLYIRGSNRRRLDFSLTYEQFAVLAASDCHYCGERHERFCTGIDRADNSKGYVVGNCVPCCWTCNQMKGRLTQSQFLSKVGQIGRHWSQR